MTAIAQRSNGSSGADFYTVKEVATKLRVTETTVYRMVDEKPKRGEQPIPVKRFGRIIRFPKLKFNRWAGLEPEGLN